MPLLKKRDSREGGNHAGLISVNHRKKNNLKIICTLFFFLFCQTALGQEGRPASPLLPEKDGSQKITQQVSDEWLADAERLIARGRKNAAFYTLQQLEKADPRNTRVLFKLGEMAIGDRNWAYAIQVFRKASRLKPEDIPVRLLLIDIYKAYQMSIQGMIVAREIVAIDPEHEAGLRHLAGLYQDQAMLNDELGIRQRYRRVRPKEYKNLKRLAVIFESMSNLWEAARIYEEIRMVHPEKNRDMTHLVSIYSRLGDMVRAFNVLDQIEKNGQKRQWLKKRAVQIYRQQFGIRDPFFADLRFQKTDGEEIDFSSRVASLSYTRIRIRSALDIAVLARFSHLRYTGRGVLKDTLNIRSGTFHLHGIKKWQSGRYQLRMIGGILVDDISGRLSPGKENSGIGVVNFPFLKDPSFNSYGGVMPLGGLQYIARPHRSLRSSYFIAYEHGQVKALDARLKLFSFDKATLQYSFLGEDHTNLIIQADESVISDGNLRFHALLSADYMLWGSGPIHDHRDRFRSPFWRKKFLRKIPLHFLKVGAAWEYFNARDNKSVFYQVFNNEKKQTYKIEAQTRLYNRGRGRNISLNLQYRHSTGTTLNYLRHTLVKLFHSGDRNEMGLSFQSIDVSATNISSNLRISGKSRSAIFSIYARLHF